MAAMSQSVGGHGEHGGPGADHRDLPGESPMSSLAMPSPGAPRSSSLDAILAAEIRARGPISVARYMDLALNHPSLGHYRRAEPIGAAGDFTTAPEIGQAFGEILGLWLAEAWAGMGRPGPVRLVELGPGRGTLMADLLRVAARVPSFRTALRVHLVETSAPLRARQQEHLAGHGIAWHDDLAEVPPGPLLLIANELLDSLPVHQLVRCEDGWRERLVDLDEAGRLFFRTAEKPSPLARGPEEAAPIGTIAEASPARAALARAIGGRIAAHGGIALLIDYGAWAEGPTGDTLQAVRRHEACDFLIAPGEVDLSSQVDFRALAEAACAGGAAVYGPVPQGTFLRAFGIELRTAMLLERAAPGQRRELRAALHRLTDPGAMGELFKVLVLGRPGDPHPPGFSAPTLAP
jgi:NADH dehydrogenase [ubiquinone] 1 alpha subcomplex assembly factor 7